MTRRRHPSPMQLATHLRDLAKMLDMQGGLALDRASLLASRGYPASVGGNGPRSSDTTSSTERAALNTHPWDGIDERITNLMTTIQTNGIDLKGLLSNVLAHADDNDPLPPGTGYCACGCEHYCSPRQNGDEDRLKNLLAPSCHRAFLRWRVTTGNPSASSADYCTAMRRTRERVLEEQKRLAQLRVELHR